MSADNDDPEIEFEEVLMTPNGNEARERCPICNRPNSPGACDTCEHYFAAYWDGDIIWEIGEGYQKFSEAWGLLLGVIYETVLFQNQDHQKTKSDLWKDCQNKAKENKAWDEIINNNDPMDMEPAEAFLNLIPYLSGPTIETDGMLSGSGHSIYMEDRGIVVELAEEITNLANLIHMEFNQ